jgi:hypothetical protein
MDGAVSRLPSVPSCTRRTLPVIYFLLDLTSWVDCKKCVFHLNALTVLLFCEMHCWKFTQFGSAGVVFCLVFIVIVFSNPIMIANVM